MGPSVEPCSQLSLALLGEQTWGDMEGENVPAMKPRCIEEEGCAMK